MAGGKKGVKKTVGRARRVEGPRPVVKMFYVKRPNGSHSLRFERVFDVVDEEMAPEAAEAVEEA